MGNAKIISVESAVSMCALDQRWPTRKLVLTIDFTNSKKLTTDYSELLEKIDSILAEY